ncbi:MAG: Acetolactate synthase large subunit [Firmicutes bacterium]|nr:Acetolactate synthase large subunit [Bacillota bacterium]MDI6706277.1 biosynthetic-type acetolactate synthase large subunit [Bacillota bacterium]
MRFNGARILLECIREQGVDTIFGYPGGAVINIYDELYKQRNVLRHIRTSHEQGAVYAADGYARATGKVGVCLATSGPGATNLVTGIATAFMDSIPIVAITGNVPLSLLGKDSFQEVDIMGITMPITKHNFIVKDISNLADTVRSAFEIAKSGRPGPVLINIPKDITAHITEYKRITHKDRKVKDIPISPDSIAQAADLINMSKRPFIYAGGGVGCSGAADELVEFAEMLDAPTGCSLMGLGCFPGTHRLFTGMIGMHGTMASNLTATNCDLLIAVGARFSDRVVSNVKRFAPNAKIVQIDIDPTEISKNIEIDCHIMGDVKKVLSQLNSHVKRVIREEWVDQVIGWKQQYPLKYKRDGGLKPQYIMEKIYELTKGEAIITTEVGQNQIWAAQYYKYTRPRTYISSGGLGTMGYGLGASIGAQVGMPHKRVINIAGDGSFLMNCNELATVVENNLPIIVVVLNNHALGMVYQWQDMFYGSRYSCTQLNSPVNFVKLADAFCAVGLTITKEEEVESVLSRALELDGPVVINCEISRDEKVFPMVPPGEPIANTILGE